MIIGMGITVLAVLIIIWNAGWACPACGRLFRKVGLRIRFCPHCGVALVDGANRYDPISHAENRAEQVGDGKPDPSES